MVETKMHVSPDMVSEDMKNWTPDDWTKHLQEMASLIFSSFLQNLDLSGLLAKMGSFPFLIQLDTMSLDGCGEILITFGSFHDVIYSA